MEMKKKLVTFVDDMTSFVRDKQSHITLLDVIKSVDIQIDD